MESVPRFFTSPADHYFLFGPRGTGKSLWTRHAYPEALRVDLLDPETVRLLAARPERLRDLIAARPDARQVVIDEVQKLPELLEVAALEGLVAQHLRAWCDYSSGGHQLFYWQTRSRLEVDFVVYSETDFHAIR